MTATARQREVRRMARRILATYQAATAADALAGEAWYTDAAATAAALAAGTHGRVTFAQAAGIIAALSPRIHWSRNVTLAAAVVDGRPVSGALPLSRRRAAAILAGGDPLAILRGPKVRAFYANLTGDTEAVTVDVWAARAAGHRGTDSFGPAAYARIADAYRMAATEAGIAPRSMQATVWIAVRGRAS